MPTRSWLAKAKSIHDLGPFYLYPNSSKPYFEKQEIRAEDKWLKKLRMPIPVASEYEPFFGSRMHDSWVLSIDRTDAVLRVRLDDIHCDIFAGGLADLLEVEPKQAYWPVDLLLHDPSYVRGARCGFRGGLRYDDPYDVFSDGPRSGDRFKRDWFHEQDGRLQWVAEFFAWRQCSRNASKFLMVDCFQVTAEDRRKAVLEAEFGPAAGVLWHEAWGGVEYGEDAYFRWSVDGMYNFLSRRMAFHGMTKADFETT